ncbi:MAG: Holliday junction branch migration protein RuvA [Clostridiales bacterium]|nr:Holliday junction branch migration protein RuvA [Clostridiales bacterium]
MIRFIKGEYLYYELGAIVILTDAGIAFKVNISDTSSLLTEREGEEVSVYTYLQVKEDGMSLYGFENTDGLMLFEQLISVNGVGPKAGLAIMSLGTPNQIKGAIAAKDSGSLTKAPGIGKKTAERVILELSDKVSALPFGEEVLDGGKVAMTIPGSEERAEAILALTTLGYTKKESESAVGAVPDENLTVEEYLKKALKFLM